MAKLQKLTISGIRSFGPNPDEIQHIKFNDTVTLFLGQNGCGKTTILETIKYALSGELPAGCSNGQGFLNDPSISNSVETKGQLRLKITDGTGREIIIIKSMQVTKQRAGTLKFKALDSMIEEIKDGERRQFSGRLVDINNFCADALQVSPCILNNVLLCHQENSSWPLEEGKKLKEKFDEIFESTRYNKCIDLLRKQYKANKDKLKVLTVERQYKQENKERVDKLKVKTEDKKVEYENKQSAVEQKQNELVPIETRLHEIGILEESFGKLEKNLATKEATRKGIVDQQNTIKQNISIEFTGTDEELSEKIRSFQNERQEDEKKVTQLERNKFEIEKRGKETNAKIQTLHSQMGQLREEKRQFDIRCSERKSLIERVKIHLKLESQISEYDVDANAESVIDLLNEEMDKQQKGLDDNIREKEGNEALLQAELDEIKERQISIRQDIAGKTETLRESEKKIGILRNELHDLEVSDSQLDVINNKIEGIDRDISSLKKTFNETEVTARIDKDKLELARMETQRSDLDQEYRLLQKNNVLIEKLDNSREAIVQKQTEINKLKSKHASNFDTLFGQGNNTPSPLRPAVRSLLDTEEKTLKKLQKKQTEKQTEVTILDANLQNQIEKVKTQQSELTNKKKQVHEVCKGKTFEEVVNKAAKDKQSFQRDKALYSSLKVVYEKFISQFQAEEPCCPICKTNFKNKAQLTSQIIGKLREEIANVPRILPELEEKLETAEEFHNKLQQLKPVNDSIQLISNTTIPAFEEELEEIKMSLIGANSELSSITKSIEPCQEKIDVCRNLISDAALLDQYQREIDRCEATIKDVESQMIRTPSNMSLPEIEAQLDTLNFDITDLRKKVDTDKLKLDKHKSRLQDLREDKSKLFEKQLDIQKMVQAKPEKEKQLSELEEKVALLKVDINDLSKKFGVVKNELTEAQKKKEQIVRDSGKVINDLRSKLTANKKLVDDIIRLHESIAQYLSENKEEQLTKLDRELTKMKEQENHIQAAAEKLVDVISKKKEDLAKQESRFRELKDNVSLREKRRAEESIKAEIEEIKRQIGSHNLSSVRMEKRTLSGKYEEIEQTMHVMRGQLHQLKVEIKELETDLNKPTNRRAFDEYRDKVYEVAVINAATADLEQYITVLEKSILEFHKDKMKQINKSIRALWRNIYRGNDIDYIEIKTEEGTGNINRRSYNYKVVQVKRGVELEMRGRCSAGQKVLACLVIRMALAEIFSSKCGILALDEPTTNLDRENIASLSDSLSRIVTDRQQQTNFQLLIITHDEDFLDTLTRVQGVSNYYRVKRNESGNSVVSREHL